MYDLQLACECAQVLQTSERLLHNGVVCTNVRYDGYPDGPRKRTKVVHKIVREHTSRVIASNEEEKSNTHKTRCYYGHGACMRTCT